MTIVLSRPTSTLPYNLMHSVYAESGLRTSHQPSVDIAMSRHQQVPSSTIAENNSPTFNGTNQPRISAPYQHLEIETAPLRPKSATPPVTHRPNLISTTGMITVVSYTPYEGEAGIPVSVLVDLHTNIAGNKDILSSGTSFSSLKMRLVFGDNPVKTTLKRLPVPQGSNVEEKNNVMHLKLLANAPFHSEAHLTDRVCVPLTVQAMNAKGEVVENFIFGSFTYWIPTTVRPASTQDISEKRMAVGDNRKRDDDEEDFHQTGFNPALLNSPKRRRVDDEEPKYRFVRKNFGPPGVAEKQAKIEFVDNSHYCHPNSLSEGWTSHELATGRKLVWFHKEQKEDRLVVSCKVISQEDYQTDATVISLLYRPETGNCWYTSIDVIFLLERLLTVKEPFTVEEKNRIRRNLEALGPTTISKTKRNHESFFTRVMDFPPPRPRNIEKDFKVFPWSSLSTALEKIIDKYAAIPVLSSDSSTSPTSRSSSVPRTRSRSGGVSRSRSRSSILPPVNYSNAQKQVHPQLYLADNSPLIPTSDTKALLPDPEQATFQLYSQSGYPLPDHWPRRGSIVSLGATSTQTDDYYPGHLTQGTESVSMPVQANDALSNPFASDVDFGSLSLRNQGHDHVYPSGVMYSSVHSFPGDTHAPDTVYHENLFDQSRRSSLASDFELLYPNSHTDPPTQNLGGTGPYNSSSHRDLNHDNTSYPTFSTNQVAF